MKKSMNILIIGAGQVGSHTAEVLTGSGHDVTIVDVDDVKLQTVTDTLDVRTLEGNGTNVDVLREAGVRESDLIVAATSSDEVNIVSASIGRALGAKASIARVHHSAFIGHAELRYETHFGINKLICPEYSTAKAIARSLRSPAALEIEEFTGGRIEMHEFPVADTAPAIDCTLSSIAMPPGTRLLGVSRGTDFIVPAADTDILRGDRVVLIGDNDVFEDARKLFRVEKPGRKSAVLMGGSAMAVWLCKALKSRAWSIRVFEANRARAEELAEKLEGVTVLNADPTDKSVFAEERIGMADAFVALHDDDEDNIVGAVLAKAGGVKEAIAVVQRPRYLDLLYHIGVDRSYSPGISAAKEIAAQIDKSPIRQLATLVTGLSTVLVTVAAGAEGCEKNLQELPLAPAWVVGAIRRGDRVFVPGATNQIEAGDVLLAVGKESDQGVLEDIFVKT
ncbi:MAG: Trk system potassium transporter TrkA [Planctomycetia bacterium]|nr:Trk system potassium transporter TrkA [Planctomycetia bacterium]MCC7315269.1 Trk system potassium transporter TrkA [Planctomycetota bacterium]